MELQQFVTETLVAVAKGVANANRQLESIDAVANPREVLDYGGGTAYVQHKETNIEFDVAVQASQAAEGDGKAKVEVSYWIGKVDVGGGKKQTAESGHTSRIQFTVPLRLPYGNGDIGNDIP